MLLSFGHSEDSLDPEDCSNCQHALGEGHHSLVRGTSLMHAKTIVHPESLLLLLDLEELIRHLSSLGEGGGEGPGEGGHLQRLPGDALHHGMQDLHLLVSEGPQFSMHQSIIES